MPTLSCKSALVRVSGSQMLDLQFFPHLCFGGAVCCRSKLPFRPEQAKLRAQGPGHWRGCCAAGTPGSALSLRAQSAIKPICMMAEGCYHETELRGKVQPVPEHPSNMFLSIHFTQCSYFPLTYISNSCSSWPLVHPLLGLNFSLWPDRVFNLCNISLRINVSLPMFLCILSCGTSHLKKLMRKVCEMTPESPLFRVSSAVATRS